MGSIGSLQWQLGHDFDGDFRARLISPSGFTEEESVKPFIFITVVTFVPTVALKGGEHPLDFLHAILANFQLAIEPSLLLVLLIGAPGFHLFVLLILLQV